MGLDPGTLGAGRAGVGRASGRVPDAEWEAQVHREEQGHGQLPLAQGRCLGCFLVRLQLQDLGAVM